MNRIEMNPENHVNPVKNSFRRIAHQFGMDLAGFSATLRVP
jgi:hypothetical protein